MTAPPVVFVEDTEQKRSQYVIKRFPQTDKELWLFVYATWGVKIPIRAVCPGHVSPFRAFADAYFARTPLAVWKASRGLGGKTFLLSLLGMTEMATLKIFITILGGSGAQSQRVHESMKEFWEAPNAPSYLLRHQTQFNTYLTNGGQARTLTASQTSVRGPHPVRLRMDEIDEMNLEILQSAQGQPMRSRRTPNVDTQTVMSSTHQYPDGTMSWALNMAKERGFPIYQWCWRETSAKGGWLTKQEIARKKSEISSEMWCVPDGTMIDTRNGKKDVVEVKIGDLVWTRKGWYPVTNKRQSGNQKVIKVVLDSGLSYLATHNHTVATPSGWVRTGDLIIGDEVVVSPPPHVIPLASQAVPMSFITDTEFADVVIPRTSCFFTKSISVNDVVSKCHQRQVSWIDANLDVAVMLDSHVGRNRSVEGDVTNAVCKRFANDQSGTIAISTNRKLPNPASISVLDRTIPNVVSQVCDSRKAASLIGTRLAAGDALTGDRCATVATGIGHVASVALQEPPVRTWDISVGIVHEFTVDSIVLHNSTEFDLQEPSFEGRAIMTESVDSCFDAGLGTASGEENIEYIFDEPRRTRDYITGVDWARDRDWTIIATFDATTTPWVCVAWMRTGRLPWPLMVRRANLRVAKYGGKFIHDATGIGNVVTDYLDLPATQWAQTDYVDQVIGGVYRQNMITEYIAAIENNNIKYPRIQFAFNEHKFVTPGDLFGSGHLPDSICAGGLAWSMRKQQQVGAGTPAIDGEGLSRASSPWSI